MSDQAWAERRDAFLERLAALTRETGIEIGGCGECGSPWLNETDGSGSDDYLAWNAERGQYTLGYDEFQR